MKTKTFDIATLLETDEDIQAFLLEASQDCTPQELISALNTAARAKGMSDIAQQAGVTRNSLYKSLSEDGNPRFDTVCSVLQALGMRVTIQPSM